MRFRRFLPVLACCTWLLSAAPQTTYDREAYAREYIQFLVLQLDQWPGEFTRQFDRALMQPPVDASKLSEAAKAGPTELADSIKRLASFGKRQDAEFRKEIDKALAAANEVNRTLATQRFPARLQSDWDQIRSTLNNLARVYKLETLAVLEPAITQPKITAGGLAGYIVDQSCARKGKGMWTNPDCVARCVREGDKVVLVTEEGKLYQIANPDKIDAESYGQKVTIIGKAEGEIVTIDSVKL